MNQPTVIRVLDDSGDSAYNQLYVATKPMDPETAQEAVDAAILLVRENCPESYTYEDLNAQLAPLGLVPLVIHDAKEEM